MKKEVPFLIMYMISSFLGFFVYLSATLWDKLPTLTIFGVLFFGMTSIFCLVDGILYHIDWHKEKRI